MFPGGPAMRLPFLKTTLTAFLVLLLSANAFGGIPKISEDCPCSKSINKLITTYETDARFKELLDASFANMQQTPPDYSARNPWMGKSFADLPKFFEQWCKIGRAHV